jgi:hypothetical protein
MPTLTQARLGCAGRTARPKKEQGMAEEKVEQRDFNFRQAFTWTELFRGFQLARDTKKLLLAAAGILTMAVSWWVLAVIFGSSTKPQWNHLDYAASKFQSKDDTPEQAIQKAWKRFRADREKWNNLWWATGNPETPEYTDAGDLARRPEDHDELQKLIDKTIEEMRTAGIRKQDIIFAGATYTIRVKPAGQLRTLPWFEERGENPYLLVTGQAGRPWQAGQFADWFLTVELPVLIEPLRKLISPVVFMLKPGNGPYNILYSLLVILVTLATWGFFGGAITRIASVQVARGETVSIREAVRFVCNRYVSYLMAPLVPLLLVAIVVVLLCVYGVVFMIPWLGDIIVAGIGWSGVLVAGLIMAVVLVGLIGWPMMYATISTEGTDTFDAISRSYSYVYQNPWSYAWYCTVAVSYGAVVIFFVGFMGSLVVYLGKWGVSQTPFLQTSWWNREPSYLFVYSPTSFGWRTLLLDGAQVDGQNVVQNGAIQPAVYDKLLGRDENYQGKDDIMSGANTAGAFLVSVWLYFFFLMILGFGYSYFWSASTIIYLLMRRQVDDTDMDEVYLEEEESEEPYSAGSGPGVGGMAGAGTSAASTAVMVDAPALRPPSSPVGSSAAVTSPPAAPAAVSSPAAPASAPVETQQPVMTEDPPKPATAGDDAS